MRRGLAATVTLALLAGGGACQAKDPAASVPVVSVKRSKFARVVDADGHLRAVKATNISVPHDVDAPMRIITLAADGTRVKKGDVVARFDDLDLKARLANAEDDQASAAAKREKEAVLVAAGRKDRVRSTGAARRELEMARSFQKKDGEIFSRDQIIESEIDGKLQGARAESAGKAQGADTVIARRKLKLIEVEARKAASDIQRAQQQLGTLQVRAPHDGVLVLKTGWRGQPMRVGDTVYPGQPIAEVPLVEEMEAEVFVLEVEAAGLAKGKKAELILENRPDQVVAAEVKRVETVAKRRQFRSPTQYFGVVLAIPRTDPAAMKPGLRVRARLFLDERDALVVPRPALFDKEGRWVAYRRDGKGFVAAPVKVGASSAGLVVVESGLKEGEVIALRDPAQSLEDILTTPAASPAARGR